MTLRFFSLWSAVLVMIVGCLLLTDLTADADSKKEEKKKEDPKKKPTIILDKSAELKKDDEMDPRTKAPRMVFPVTLTAGKKYQIDLKSKDFDAYLRLLDAKDAEVAFNENA